MFHGVPSAQESELKVATLSCATRVATAGLPTLSFGAEAVHQARELQGAAKEEVHVGACLARLRSGEASSK